MAASISATPNWPSVSASARLSRCGSVDVFMRRSCSGGAAHHMPPKRAMRAVPLAPRRSRTLDRAARARHSPKYIHTPPDGRHDTSHSTHFRRRLSRDRAHGLQRLPNGAARRHGAAGQRARRCPNAGRLRLLGAIARYRGVMENDHATGHVNQSVYDQIQREIAEAAAACSAGQDARAVSLIHASKSRHGYPG